MSEVEPARPCICGRLYGLDRSREWFVACLCREILHIRPDAGGWFIQHGTNPEHRSPNYTGDNLLAACDWVDSVCLEARHE